MQRNSVGLAGTLSSFVFAQEATMQIIDKNASFVGSILD
jgi:hypothetical protein